MQNGEVVRIAYVGRLESGEVFDLTDAELAKKSSIFNPKARYAPVPVVVGGGFVIPGLDHALEQMSVGEKKSVVVEPKDGFGERDPKLVRTIPARNFGRDTPKPGMVVDFGGVKGRVQSVTAGRVRVDFNHPLAGKRLTYDIEVKEKIEGAQPQANAILEFFGLAAQALIEGEACKITGHVVHPAKQRVSEAILKWVPGVKRVDFVESFEQKPEDKEGQK